MGVIGEYNPFHNGHAYHLASCRELAGPDSAVICVMSGDFVQRGETAVYSKFARAEAACRCGADLVIELPARWSLSSAEGFARGGVSLLQRLGASVLCFGSESGDTERLMRVAALLAGSEIYEEIRRTLAASGDLSFARARLLAVRAQLGEDAELLASPNDILAVEYCKAILSHGAQMVPYAIPRRGAGHDEADGAPGFRSASAIRAMLRRGEDVRGELPAEAAAVYERETRNGRRLSEDVLETAALSRLRMYDAAYFSALPDAGDGLGLRIYRAVREASDLQEIVETAKTKRYPTARIRRILLRASLDLCAEAPCALPPYARVLAANARGRAHLASIRETEALPLVTKPASVHKLSVPCQAVFRETALAHDFYTLCFADKKARTAGEDWKTGPAIV
ncbi:MAG: nucleotidyltransferase family protein [Oscillospiraceae bacterium]|nr:nucleotidyltransferase family protein [Oscillospiraceae bacterium]